MHILISIVKTISKRAITQVRIWIKLYRNQTIWISLGENCLTDNILQRHGLKVFSTPYSHCRSNLDYSIFFEQNDYSPLIQAGNFKYHNTENRKVLRCIVPSTCDDIYHPLHCQGLELTHHDIFAHSNNLRSFKRKVSRMIKLKALKRKRIIHLYHYRSSAKQNVEELIKKGKVYIDLFT